MRCVQDVAHWPTWTLANYAGLSSLGENITDVDIYDTQNCFWMQVELHYIHIISSDCFIFMRRRGITCLGFDEHINRLRPASIRPSIVIETDNEDSGSNLETVSTALASRYSAGEDIAPFSHLSSQRPCLPRIQTQDLHSSTIPSLNPHTNISMSTATSASTLPSFVWYSTGSSSSPASSIPSSNPASPDSESQRFSSTSACPRYPPDTIIAPVETM